MKQLAACLICLLAVAAASALDLTASNELRLAVGEETEGDATRDRNYIENIFGFDLSGYGLLLHGELGAYHPSEFPGDGIETDRLLAGWLEYNGPLG